MGDVRTMYRVRCLSCGKTKGQQTKPGTELHQYIRTHCPHCESVERFNVRGRLGDYQTGPA